MRGVFWNGRVNMVLALGGAVSSCSPTIEFPDEGAVGTGGGGHASTSSMQASHAAQSSSSGGGTTCAEVTLGMFENGGADGNTSTYTAPTMPDTGDAKDPDQASMEFYGSSFDPSYDGEKTGTFDLSAAGDDDYATCSRCLRISFDPMAPGRMFFQKSGTLTVDAASDQLSGTVEATLTDVTLIEVTIDSTTFESIPVPGGACLHIAAAGVSFMKMPPPAGWTCEATYYDDGNCDCGCGAVDTDCKDANVSSCEFCDEMGSCSMAMCPGTINPTNNAVCN